jgi:hypothetical protein
MRSLKSNGRKCTLRGVPDLSAATRHWPPSAPRCREAGLRVRGNLKVNLQLLKISVVILLQVCQLKRRRYAASLHTRPSQKKSAMISPCFVFTVNAAQAVRVDSTLFPHQQNATLKSIAASNRLTRMNTTKDLLSASHAFKNDRGHAKTYSYVMLTQVLQIRSLAQQLLHLLIDLKLNLLLEVATSQLISHTAEDLERTSILHLLAYRIAIGTIGLMRHAVPQA